MRKRAELAILILFVLTVSFSSHRAAETAIPNAVLRSVLKAPSGSGAVNVAPDLPLHFVENRGQTAREVSHVLQTRQGNIYFTPQEIVFQFVVPENGGTAMQDLISLANSGSVSWTESNLRLQFLGARRDLKVRALSESPARFSYFIGNDPDQWVREAKGFEKLIYPDLYPGIDLLVSGRSGKLKNEYVVRPGGDPAEIAIRYRGAAGLKTNERGQLEIAYSAGTLIEDAPECFQEIDGRRVPVEASFRIEQGDTVRIEVGEYRRDAELVIDPVIYGTFLGGSGSDYGLAVARDDTGNVYIAGLTASTTTFPTTGGAYDTSFNGGPFDVFVSKFNSTLSSLLYSTYIGGSGYEGAQGSVVGLAVDDGGNAYIAGHTDSPDYPRTPGALRTVHNGTYDAFVTKINATGSALVFSTYLGGSDRNIAYVVATDDTGSIVGVCGLTQSTDFPVTTDAYDTTHNGMADGFLTILNSAGTGLVYSTYFGGTGSENIAAVGADDDGNIYFTGLTTSNDLPATVGAYDTTFNGGTYDGYLAKLNSSLDSLAYMTYLGGSAFDLPSSIEVVEETGEAFVIGRTNSLNFPVTFGAFQTAYGGGAYDAFATKVNAAGNTLLYSTYLGGSDNDGARGLSVKQDKTAVICGYTYSADFPTTSDGTDRSYNGGTGDAFVARLNRAGTDLVYSTFLGGSSNDDAYQIVFADSINYLVAGLTSSSTFPTSPGGYDTTINGQADAFALILSVPFEIVANIVPGDFDADGTDEAAVDFGALGAWIWDGGTWSILTGSDPEGMMAADADGNGDDEIVADMGLLGLWLWNGGAWTQLSGVNVVGMAAGDFDGSGDDEVVGDFSAYGLWIWDSGVWTQLNGVDADRVYAGDVDGNGRCEIVGDFGRTGFGLWLWNAGAWFGLSEYDADSVRFAEIDGTAGKEMAVDFGERGFWIWDSNVWTALSILNAEGIIAGDVNGGGVDEMIVDFGDTGLWLWNGGVWGQISSLNAVKMVAADTDGNGDKELVVDFGHLGLWTYDGGAWSQISSPIAEYFVAANVDGDGAEEILVAFREQGFWLWNGGVWTQLSGATPD